MHYIILIDTSYSMKSKLHKLITGLNNFVETIRNNPDTFLSVVSFSKNMYYICRGLEVSKVGIFDMSHFKEFNLTSLYDSICTILIDWEAVPGKHNLFIITDGDDNSSRKYNKEQTDVLCSGAMFSGNWEIIHCHTEISNLMVNKKVVYQVDDISNILDNLVI